MLGNACPIDDDIVLSSLVNALAWKVTDERLRLGAPSLSLLGISSVLRLKVTERRCDLLSAPEESPRLLPKLPVPAAMKACTRFASSGNTLLNLPSTDDPDSILRRLRKPTTGGASLSSSELDQWDECESLELL